jgi:hypothetical protein
MKHGETEKIFPSVCPQGGDYEPQQYADELEILGLTGEVVDSGWVFPCRNEVPSGYLT